MAETNTAKKNNLLDMEQTLHDSRAQRDDFRQSSPPPTGSHRASQAWGQRYGALDNQAASGQDRLTEALRSADSGQLDALTKRLEERRARKVEAIEQKEGSGYLPEHMKGFGSNVDETRQQVFRGYQGYDNGRAAQTVAGAAEDRQQERDQNTLQSRLGRRATHDEMVAFEAQRAQDQQVGQTQPQAQQASDGQGMQFGSLAARRERGVSTYAERNQQAQANQAAQHADTTVQKKRQQGYEESFGQSM